MTNPGSLGGFPGNWNYQGEGTLLVGDTVQSIMVSLHLVFTEETEIDVKLNCSNIPKEEFYKLVDKIHETKTHVLIIQKSVVVVGFSTMHYEMYRRASNFTVTRLITYSCFPKDHDPYEDSEYFVKLKAYLNDEYSSHDDAWSSEFENVPQRYRRNRAEEEIEKSFLDSFSLYCALNSGYEVQCGKKFVTHKDHDLFYRRNIETLYRLSFIDVTVSLKSERLSLPKQGDLYDETYLVEHLEDTLNDACGFLSIVRDHEILPIYYDYSIYSKNRYTYGRIIPVWNRRKIPKINKAWINSKINFFHDVALFLECCPLDKRLSRGIHHLKLTVYEATIELRLMAACSAIEYFYAYWLSEMDGASKLLTANENNRLTFLSKNDVCNLEALKSGSNKHTPPLSKIISFFLRDIGSDWENHVGNYSFEFIQIRNYLLHGNFTSDETTLFSAEDSAQKIGTEILFRIMKVISKSNHLELYDELPVGKPSQDFYVISNGWTELRNALNELYDDSDASIFWD